MTENKRFQIQLDRRNPYKWNVLDGDKFVCQNDYKKGAENICDILNNLHEEKEELIYALNQRTEQCDKLHEENEQFHNIANDYNISFDKLCETFEQCLDENEQLKKDATILVCSNQEYRKENARMQETLQKKEELLRSVLKVNDNLTKKIRELEEDNLELKEAMKRMMGDLMSR